MNKDIFDLVEKWQHAFDISGITDPLDQILLAFSLETKEKADLALKENRRIKITINY